MHVPQNIAHHMRKLQSSNVMQATAGLSAGDVSILAQVVQATGGSLFMNVLRGVGNLLSNA